MASRTEHAIAAKPDLERAALAPPEVNFPSHDLGYLVSSVKGDAVLSDSYRDLLHPAIRTLPPQSLRETVVWPHDRLGLFGPPRQRAFASFDDGQPRLGPRIQSALYKCPDAETTYAVLTDGTALGVAMVWEREWHIIGIFQLPNILEELHAAGFVYYPEMRREAAQELAGNGGSARVREADGPAGTGADHETASDDDYWKRYDNAASGDEEGAEQNEARGSGTANGGSGGGGAAAAGAGRTRLYLRSFLFNFTRDLWTLYRDAGASADAFARDLLAGLEAYHGRRVEPARSHEFLYNYSARAAATAFRHAANMGLPEDEITADLELALLDVDPRLLDRLLK